MVWWLLCGKSNSLEFGGWIWGKDDPVHGKKYKRFAKFVDGSEEKPG